MVYFRIILVSIILNIVLIPQTELLAQIQTRQEVMVLPYIMEESEQELVWELYEAMLPGIRLRPWMVLVEKERMLELLGDQSIHELLGDIRELERFTTRTGLEYLVGISINRVETDQIQITGMIFNAEDREILHVQQRIYADQYNALENVDQFAHDLSHPNNFSTADVSLLYSMLIPGLGQLNEGAKFHALVCVGLLGSAALYGLRAPDTDPFMINGNDFEAEYNSSTGYYDFSVRHQQVSEVEFYTLLEADMKHSEEAEDERRVQEKWKRRTQWMLIAGYAINLLDTFLLVKRGVDTSPFFLSLETTTISGLKDHSGQIGFCVGIRFF